MHRGYDPLRSFDGALDFETLDEAVVVDARQKAMQGNMHSQYFLALTLLYGSGGDAHAAEAARWFDEAGEQGHIESLTNLAMMKLGGVGVGQDVRGAAELLQRASEAGDEDAPWLLGRMYYDELTNWEGVNDMKMALQYFQLAAERGSARGMFYAGIMYEYGLGMKARDLKEASTWYKQAADLGDAEAMYYYALQHMYGRGVRRNAQEAISLFHESAGLNHAPAMMYLGKVYQEGIGIGIDYNRAISWYGKAAAHGDENLAPQARARRDEIKKGTSLRLKSTFSVTCKSIPQRSFDADPVRIYLISSFEITK